MRVATTFCFDTGCVDGDGIVANYQVEGAAGVMVAFLGEAFIVGVALLEVVENVGRDMRSGVGESLKDS